MVQGGEGLHAQSTELQRLCHSFEKTCVANISTCGKKTFIHCCYKSWTWVRICQDNTRTTHTVDGGGRNDETNRYKSYTLQGPIQKIQKGRPELHYSGGIWESEVWKVNLCSKRCFFSVFLIKYFQNLHCKFGGGVGGRGERKGVPRPYWPLPLIFLSPYLQ